MFSTLTRDNHLVVGVVLADNLLLSTYHVPEKMD